MLIIVFYVEKTSTKPASLYAPSKSMIPGGHLSALLRPLRGGRSARSSGQRSTGWIFELFFYDTLIVNMCLTCQ